MKLSVRGKVAITGILLCVSAWVFTLYHLYAFAFSK